MTVPGVLMCLFAAFNLEKVSHLFVEKSDVFLQISAAKQHPDWEWTINPEWLDDPRFATMEKREENCREFIELLDREFATRPYHEWRNALRQKTSSSACRYNFRLLEDPQVLVNDYLPEVEHPELGRMRWLLTL